tara:strand:- start:223 stop:1113 length:891 start_codon:yes stop_codon:yes gene_type:complete
MKESKNKENREYWKPEEEDIIKEWSDKALCYQWMHSKCREIYQIKNAWFTIPVIIISTLTGTANFAQDRVPEDYREYFVIGIGSLSLIAGIITTINQFLQISELNEGYRATAIAWNKLHNNLKTLIMRHPLDRIEPSQAIKLYKDEYDHLVEISPPIVKKVITQFNAKFKKTPDLSKPEICNKLVPTSVFKMSEVEREVMINKINNKKKNPKLMETFFSLNGVNASDEELDILQTSIDDVGNDGINDGGNDSINDGGNDSINDVGNDSINDEGNSQDDNTDRSYDSLNITSNVTNV